MQRRSRISSFATSGDHVNLLSAVRFSSLVVCSLTFLGCQDPSTPTPVGSVTNELRPTVSHEAKAVSPEDRARLGFRATQAGYAAAQPTHAVTVKGSSLRMQPIQYIDERAVVGHELVVETRSVTQGDTALASAFTGETT